MKKNLLFLLGLFFAFTSKAQTAAEVLEKMLHSIDHLDGLSFDYKSKERYGDAFVLGEGTVKISSNPLKINLYQLKPDPVEIIYNESISTEKALVKAKKLPLVKLGIYSEKMRKRSHHPLTHLGFDHLAALIKKMQQQTNGKLASYFKLSHESWKGKNCYKLTLDYQTYLLEIYRTEKDIFPREIAAEKNINEYKIIELNELKNHGKIEEGYYLTLPNFYAKKIILIIDKKNNLPVFQSISDEKGLFETYEYLNLKRNPTFTPTDFARP